MILSKTGNKIIPKEQKQLPITVTTKRKNVEQTFRNIVGRAELGIIIPKIVGLKKMVIKMMPLLIIRWKVALCIASNVTEKHDGQERMTFRLPI